MKVKISILIVNLNNLEYTKNVINDLLLQDTPFNLYLYDQNSSEEGTKEYMNSLFESHMKNEFIGKIHVMSIYNTGYNRPLNHIWNDFVKSIDTEFVCLLNNDIRLSPNFISSSLEVFDKVPNLGVVSHTTNSKDYQSWSEKLEYSIQHSPYRQGWDLIFKTKLYSNIPEELTFFYGDDYIFSKLYENGYIGAYILNSPIIHYEAKTTTEKNGIRDASKDGEVFTTLNVKYKNLKFNETFSKWKPEFNEIVKKSPNNIDEQRELKFDDIGISNDVDQKFKDKVYITHTTKNYLSVAHNLAKSIREFSKLPIIIYGIDITEEDTTIFNDIENIEIKILTLNLDDIKEYSYSSSGNFYVNRLDLVTYNILTSKVIAMKEVLNEGWNEVCYLDADCLATPLIDEIFTWSNQITDYPLATKGIHEYMIIHTENESRGNVFGFGEDSTWPIADNKKCLEYPLMNLIGLTEFERGTYTTTGIMLMNQNCIPFINNWINTINIIKKTTDVTLTAPFHEETIFNVLSWQIDKENKYLPLNYINLKDGIDTVKDFYNPQSDNDILRFYNINDISTHFYRIPENKKNVKVLHGEKLTSEANKIILYLKELKENGYFKN